MHFLFEYIKNIATNCHNNTYLFSYIKVVKLLHQLLIFCTTLGVNFEISSKQAFLKIK